VNPRAAVAALCFIQPRIRVCGLDGFGSTWLRYCDLCALAADDMGAGNYPRRPYRHFGISTHVELWFSSWGAAMLSARDHLEAHRRALPAQIGES
jgi:hypothetical protein